MTSLAEKTTGAEDILWNLSDLYHSPEDAQIEADMQTALTHAQTLADTYYGKVATLTAQQMLEAMTISETIVTLLTKLGSYAFMIWSTETTNPVLGKLQAKVQEHRAEINQKTLFFEIEWANAPAEVEKILDDPLLKRFAHYLRIARLYQPHTLTEPEEKVASQMSLTGMNSWNRYFGEITSHFRFPWEGEMVTLSEMTTLLRAPERETRRKAADVLTEVLHQNSHATTYVFNMMLLDKQTQDKMRNHKTWVSARNLSNQVDDETVDALVNAVTSRYDIVGRYYDLLKTRLGVDELYDYDRYAPLETVKTKISWDGAKDLVLNAFAEFDGRMAEIASEFFDRNWIDAPIKMGKRGGAYCSSTSVTVHPYVFMNYDGTIDSVRTLAHELGHGIHGYLARVQGEFQADTPLTTAEMASTFCEMVVFDYMVNREKDPQARFAMRMGRIADAFATIFRQTSMNRFEHAIHTARRAGGELSKDQISELWMQNQQPMFGDSLKLRDQYSIWWSYIPHFIGSPGYVYAYSFGELLVWALYARYQAAPSGFAHNYLLVLQAGGSDYPHKILAPMGVDLQDPEFWHEGLGLLDDFVAQTEADAKKI